MQRKLLILGCILFTLNPAFAQRKNTKENPAYVKLTTPGTGFLYPAKETTGNNAQIDYKAIHAELPKFQVIDYKGENKTKSILNGSNLLVMMFNPTCDHCEEQTRILESNIALFQKSKILMVSGPMMVPLLSYFDANTHISQYPTATVTVDSAAVISRLFNYVALPQINIYSGKDLRLLKTFNGVTPIDSLKAYIE